MINFYRRLFSISCDEQHFIYGHQCNARNDVRKLKLIQEAKTHRERELKKAEEDLDKMKKKAEKSCKDMKEKEQVCSKI